MIFNRNFVYEQPFWIFDEKMTKKYAEMRYVDNQRVEYLWENFWYWYQKEHQGETSTPNQPYMILDLGCGPGRVTIPLLQYLLKNQVGFKYIGVDLSYNMLLELKKQIIEKKTSLGFSTEYIEKWGTMLQNNGDALTYLAEQVNPKVYGLLNVKKAIVLSITSPNDKWGDRGRCHVLLYGPPGTAKSALGEWLVYNLNIEGISHRSSDVGLTGCAIGKEIVPGALPCANDSSIYIEIGRAHV